jgi:hypothetical protein
VTSAKDACVTKRKVILNVDGDDEVHAPKLRLNAKSVCDPGNSKISHVS